VFGPAVRTLVVSSAKFEIWGPKKRDNVAPDEEPSPEDRDSLPSNPPSEDPLEAGGASSPERTQVNTDANNRDRDDQRYMTSCGIHKAHLSLALTALPNCRSITVFRSSFYPYKGIRPLNDKQIRLWINHADSARRVLHVVLAASVASRISLEELNIQLYDPDSDIRAIEFIPELAAQQMHSCLADLKALRLRFCSKDWVFSDSTADSLVQLLELCPAVALLELRLGMRNKPSLFTAIAGVHMTALRDQSSAG
jgi:hypothetical protein